MLSLDDDYPEQPIEVLVAHPDVADANNWNPLALKVCKVNRARLELMSLLVCADTSGLPGYDGEHGSGVDLHLAGVALDEDHHVDLLTGRKRGILPVDVDLDGGFGWQLGEHVALVGEERGSRVWRSLPS